MAANNALPLVVPSGRNAKTYEDIIYANPAGLLLLRAMLDAALAAWQRVERQTVRNGESVVLRIEPSKQDGFDVGGAR